MQARLMGKAVTLALVVAVPVLAIAFLGSPFATANAGTSTAELALPTPSTVKASESMASVKGETQAETVLDNWTYTKRPISRSH